jgi:hypothetical protein
MTSLSIQALVSDEDSQRKRNGDCVISGYHAHPSFTPVYEEMQWIQALKYQLNGFRSVAKHPSWGDDVH